MTDPRIDLDDLLSLTDDDETTTPEAADVLADVTAVEVKEEAPVEKPEPKKRAPRKPRTQKAPETVEVEETPEQKRIRELQAELAKPALRPTTDATGRPLPDSELDAEQRQIRDLEDALARRKAEEATVVEAQYDAPTGQGEQIHIHFLLDGLLVNGTTTYRGQEMIFEKGSRAYKQTQNRLGESFLDLVDDVDAQYDRWGDHYIARGPWRGRKWGDTSTITDPQDKAAALAAAQAEARRGLSAPVSTF